MRKTSSSIHLKNVFLLSLLKCTHYFYVHTSTCVHVWFGYALCFIYWNCVAKFRKGSQVQSFPQEMVEDAMRTKNEWYTYASVAVVLWTMKTTSIIIQYPLAFSNTKYIKGKEKNKEIPSKFEMMKNIP